jgi:metal-responsive CopG/Arc/MetJ family transcriptional regulator
MKVKTSITLSKTTLRAVDKLAGKNGNRSAIIERAVREYLARGVRELRDRHDLAIFRKHAAEYEEVIQDMLAIQTLDEGEP